MARVPVPDDYERGYVSVAGRDDYHYGEADVNLDAVDTARNVSVQEDDDGRYVGVSEEYADEVADYLDSATDGETDAPARSDEDTDDETDGDEVHTCAGSKANGDPCTREVDEPGGYCYQHPPED